MSDTANISKVLRDALQQGMAIPAHPLALTSRRKLDERRQRALTRYYAAAGAGGVAVGVHTTQFEIRDCGLFEPVLEIAREELDRADEGRDVPMLRVGGVCGRTKQAVAEAALLRDHGYHAALLSLSAFSDDSEDAMVAHCAAVADVLPVFGFYLQPAVGGRVLAYSFWRRFCEIENVVAIKMAPFNRYQTHDVVRAVVNAGRDDIALYTGNDDAIVADLLSTFRFDVGGEPIERRIVGGLLGHWSVWTRCAVGLLESCHAAGADDAALRRMVYEATAVTEMNAAIFDVANGFRGCIAGIHYVLQRQGLFEGLWCLDEDEGMSSGQAEGIDRVCATYPHLVDDDFVTEHRDAWLS